MEVKLKNVVIKNLLGNGLENTTDHSLSATSAYRVFKFRHAIADAYKEIDEKRKKLVEENIGDGLAFDLRKTELETKGNRTEEEEKELAELQQKADKFAKLYNELLNDETEIKVTPISFEQYHLLANENKQTPIDIPLNEISKDGTQKVKRVFIDFFTVWRDELKDILWEEPEDED